MSVVIRNIDTVEHVYSGQTIAVSASYTIQASERSRWASNDALITDITDGKAQVNNGTSDITGVAAQIAYLLGQDTAVRDSDGAYIQRNKAAQAGWTYQLKSFEFKTSTLNAVYNKDAAGADIGDVTVKFYDAANAELTSDLSTCVKTVVDMEPTFNYELVGGSVRAVGNVTTDTRVWVIAVPEIAAQYGGSKVMVNGVNLKFVNNTDGVEADGRASKFMSYSATYHTNKLRFVIKHAAAEVNEYSVFMELFKG